MAVSRRKELIRRRRRIEDEGEEEEGSVVGGLEDDSLSEGSAITDEDDDADGEGSDGSDIPEPREVKQSNGITASPKPPLQARQDDSATSTAKPSFHMKMTDTQAMMNGLKFSGDVDEGEEVDFEDMGKEAQAILQPQEPLQDLDKETGVNNIGEHRRREHEEYRKKRDADPAFVPNRGGFFMHDHRSAAPGQNGFRPFGRGRGRGRGAVTGPFPTTGPISKSSGPSDAPWAHDLHETVAQPDRVPATRTQADIASSQQQAKPMHRSLPPNRSFSTSVQTGNVQIRVCLSGMTSPITVPTVPVYRHTRLPHHRPPLRRDKPVRISIPEMQIRYIFPSVDRSFIFIPRALRPNQQGFGRVRGRGSFSGGYGGFSSRRTSAYAGSNYSPSVALSRRSSLAREVPAEAILSPNGPPTSRLAFTIPEPNKPIVRLPPAAEQTQNSVQELVAEPVTEQSTMSPTVNLPQPTAYPPPQDPTFRENRPAPLPMHQPRPQKTVSVADIESPAFNPPQQQQQQPFHQQMPVQVSGQQYQAEAPIFPHSRHPSHPSQASGGTPISQIPEQAIHAQPFQSYPYQPPQAIYAQQYPPPLYYYPPPDPSQSLQHSVTAPAFVPGQPYAFPMPLAPIPPPPHQGDSASQVGTVAHESNGMVYYYDSSQLATAAEGNPSYPPAAYSMPPPGNMVGMPPPVPFFPQPAAAPFYPPQ